MRRLPLALPALLLACGPPAAPIDAPKPAATASTPSATASAPPRPPVEIEDPRIVRCGIDDRPRSVSETQPGERAWLGAPPPTGPRNPPDDPLGDVAPPPASRVRIEIERLAPTAIPGAPLPEGVAGTLASRDPQYDVCRDLVGAADTGTHSHRIELAATGLPLRVISDAAPSKLERCLMERSCQLRASNGPASALLSVAVRRFEPAPFQPPTGTEREVTVATVPNDTPEPVRRMLALIGRRCATQTAADPGTMAMLRVTQRPTSASGRRSNIVEVGAGAGRRAPPPDDGVMQTTARVGAQSGERGKPFGACIAGVLERQRANLSAPFRATVVVR